MRRTNVYRTCWTWFSAPKSSYSAKEEQQPESDSRVSEPTSDSQLLSAVNPDCSAALGENRVCVDGAVEMLVLLFFPPDSQQLSLPVSEEEVPPEQQLCEQERSPSQRQEDPEPTQIKEEQEELRTNQSFLVENIEERVDEMERHIPPPFSPDSQQPSLSVSKEEVPPEQQERSPRLGLEDPEPTKQEELWTNQEEQQLESDSRVSEPTSDSQLLSAVNPECSAAQNENGKVHQSPSTSSEQVSSNVESNEASHFSTWSEENISATDSNSSDRSSCTKEDSEARKPAKRTCHSSGVVNEPSDLSNFCDENHPGTEIRPSDGNKDMNIQTDSGAHNPAKRICRRVPDMSEGAVARRGSGEMASCSRPKVPGSTRNYTHCLHCQGLYIRKSLWKHVRYCPLNPKAEEPKPGQKMRIQSAMVFKLCPQPDYVSTGLWKIVCGMNSGQVSFVVRNDKCILLMGEEMYNKLPPDDRRNKYIQQRMREVARLLITARTCTPLMCFEDLVIPSNLPHVITAVRAVAGYNEENKTYDCPTLAVQMGYNLMNIGSAVESSALTSGQHKVAESAGKFKSFKWNEVVLAGALSTLSEPKNTCPQPTAVTQAPYQPTPVTQAPCQPTPVTQAPYQPTPVTQAPCQPTPVTQAPCQPTPVTQAPCQPTPVTQAPCQPTPVTQAPCQPTPVTQAPCQPTPVTQAPCQPTPVTQAPCQPTPVTQAPCQPTPVTQAPCQPTPVTQAPCQPTPVTQAPCQPTPVTQAPCQPTPVTQAPCQPTPVTQAPCQPTPVTQAPCQPTPVTQAPCQPTPVTQAPCQPTPVTQAPCQPTRRTRTQPTRRTRTQPTRRTRTQPTRRTRTQPTRRTRTQLTPVALAPGQPTRRTGTQPTRGTGTQPTRGTGTQPTRGTGTQPTRGTGTQPTRGTGTQPTRRTGTQPTRRTGTQPTRRNTVRLKWITDEVAAVEKHMMPFIKSSRVPEKRDCLKCLQSEPVALKSRDWSGIKFYVNRVKQRLSTAGESEGSSPDRDSTSGPAALTGTQPQVQQP
ncbi:mucin-5AC-like isoform X2 [Salvelinus namaycush]|uniref:Mucin-5AC-like isoform X2 n=1 Tax=Salvelinus namaycush TaxID=8040 RepID=A0A8U0QUS6_SALNM|nr:mucin-5AC-like isoform X2 [Salvelinus namaycush]